MRASRRGRASVLGVVVWALLVVAPACGIEEDAVDRSGAPDTSVDGRNPTIPAPDADPDPGGSSLPEPPGPTAASTSSAPAATAPSEPVPATPTGDIPPVVTAPATGLLDGLTVAPVDPDLPDYRRKAFGDGWDHDGPSGCNTRELVLIHESIEAPVMGERCKPLSGRWISAYDGVATTDPADLEIDHFVPLAEAWRTGAAAWSDQRREAFANDLTDPATLVAVTSRSNRSKGDSPPDRWLPPSLEARCSYVEDWIRVKSRWSLAVSPAEKATLVQVLSGC